MLATRLDVTDPASIQQVAADLDRRYGLDVLVNNAAIHDDTWQRASTADLQVVREALEVNLFGAWQTSLTLLPAAPKPRRPHRQRLQRAGSLASMDGGPPAYNVSKAALNALTRMLASELRHDRILVNASARAGSPPTGRPRRASSRPGRGQRLVGRRPARRRAHRRLLPRRPSGALVTPARSGRSLR